MERLTKRRRSDGLACPSMPEAEAVAHWADYLQDVANKLCDYEDAEEQGLLIKLPCKIGTVCYRIDGDTVTPVFFNHAMIPLFGKTVFLYYNEAEAMLMKWEEEEFDSYCESCKHGSHWDGVVMCSKDGQRHERTDGCRKESQ